MNRNLGIVAGCVLIFAVIYFAWGWLGQEQPQTPQQLTQQAIEAKDPVQCEKAVAKLAQLPRTGYKAAKHFREVLKKSDLPTVRATAIQGLSSEGDYDSMSRNCPFSTKPEELAFSCSVISRIYIGHESHRL